MEASARGNEMRGKNDKAAMGPTEQNRNDH